MSKFIPVKRFLVRWVWLLLLGGLWFVLSCLTRSLGVRPVNECPKQYLSTVEVQAHYQRGVALTQRGKMGEHRLMSSIYDGLPLLKTAATHWHLAAMQAYGGYYIRQGALEMSWFDGLMPPDATSEGMMWSILGVHLGDDVQAHDAEIYRVLTDPETPFPSDYFQTSSGTAWMFQMVTEPGLDWARRQAFAWRGCFSKQSPDVKLEATP